MAMDPLSKIFGIKRKKYGTGFWPFYNPRPWDFNPPAGEIAVTDPVAVAFELTPLLQRVGWPGLSLMTTDFQIELLDTEEKDLEGKVAAWFDENRPAVSAELMRRLPTYNIGRLSSTADSAMQIACRAYNAEEYLTTVRLLIPEFEAIGRGLVTDKLKKTSQSRVIKDLQEAINETPLIKDDPVELLTTIHFVEESLFASCYTEADAQALGPTPNRHAELHGLGSYGNLQGASVVLCCADIVYKLAARLLDLGYTA